MYYYYSLHRLCTARRETIMKKNYMLHLLRLRDELKTYFCEMVDEEGISMTAAENFISSEWEREIISLDHKGVCGVLLDHALWWL